MWQTVIMTIAIAVLVVMIIDICKAGNPDSVKVTVEDKYNSNIEMRRIK